MALDGTSVNTVYQTVLLILNKEQRGYITPDEFNKTATQVQLDIFEQYFEDLNQQLRVPQADIDYADRQMNIDEKIAVFKAIGSCSFSVDKFSLPTIDDINGLSIVYNEDDITDPITQAAFYRLGAVTYEPNNTDPVELQRLQRFDFYNIEKSKLTKSTVNFPTYLYEGTKLFVRPTSIQSDIKASFIRKPRNVVWAFSPGSKGQYEQDIPNSQNFELLPSEQVEIILRILQYSGIIIRDPQIVQAAASEIQQNEINQKS